MAKKSTPKPANAIVPCCLNKTVKTFLLAPTTPVVISFILKTDGSYILKTDGSKIERT